MIDFQLTESGDIAMEESMEEQQCKVSFYISDANVQRISFITEGKSSSNENYAQQKIRFFTTDKPRHAIQCTTAENMQEKMQAIRLYLMTELMDIPYDREYGSLLFKQRHNILRNSDTYSEVSRIITKVVNEYMPTARVEILDTEGSRGYFAFSMYTVNLYDEDELITSFTF